MNAKTNALLRTWFTSLWLLTAMTQSIRAMTLSVSPCYEFRTVGNLALNKVFYGEIELRDADVETFELLAPAHCPGMLACSNQCSPYARDKRGVFFQGVRVKQLDTDPSSFHFLDPTYGYAVDRNHVYSNGVALDGINPKYFHQEGGYWQDNKTVIADLSHRVMIPRAKFKAFGGNYVSDGATVYTVGCSMDGQAIKGADPSSFKVLRDGDGYFSAYAVDGQNAYFCGLKLSGSPDLETLHTTNARSTIACDKHGCFSAAGRAANPND